MSETMKIDPVFRKSLIRHYYFAEAMAVYERFYQPLVSTYPLAQQELTDPGRQEDRPPTWIPLVFHCTTEENIGQIFREGILRPGKNGAVAFTEIPIGELDRMKYRHHAEHQVAIGFPRRYIQSLGLTPAWYLKHNPEIVALLGKWEACDPTAFAAVKPFIDEYDDVAPFQEVRTTASVDIEEAVWLLATNRDAESRPAIPDIDIFREKYGRISQSFWHRSHQIDILSEWQFTKLRKNEHGVPVGFQFMGEHYWRKVTTEKKGLRVTFPAHAREIMFDTTKRDEHEAFEGPFRFLDVARSIARVLAEAGEDLHVALRYRLIRDISA
jgi:hypothetical protein